MRIRYLYYIALAIAAGFLAVASAGFPLSTVVNLTLGVGIATLVVSLGIAAFYRESLPALVVAAASAVVSAWMIVASQVYAPTTVDNITFASALVLGALALIGLTAHELGAERVVRSVEVGSSDRDSLNGPQAAAA